MDVDESAIDDNYDGFGYANESLRQSTGEVNCTSKSIKSSRGGMFR
jgi:hypothetical protein